MIRYVLKLSELQDILLVGLDILKYIYVKAILEQTNGINR